MGFFKKLNKLVKDSLDIDLEKEANELMGDSMDEWKDTLGALKNSKGGILSGAKKLMSEGLASIQDTDDDVLPQSLKDSKLGKAVSLLGSLANNAKNPQSNAAQATIQTQKPVLKENSNPVFTTGFVKMMAEQLKESATVDSDGNVVADFDKAEDRNIKWEKTYEIYSDHLTVKSTALEYPSGFDSEGFVRAVMGSQRFKDVFTAEITRVNGVVLTARMKASDIEACVKEVLNIDMLLQRAWAILAESIEKDSSYKVRFSTQIITKLLDNSGATYTVDEDGDVRADHSYAEGKPIDWYVWYMITPDTLTIESGCRDMRSDFDVDAFENELMKHDHISRLISFGRSSKGGMRIKSRIEAGNTTEVASKWDEVNEFLESLWAAVYDINGSLQDEEDRRERDKREAEARKAREREAARGREEEQHNEDDREEETHRRKPLFNFPTPSWNLSGSSSPSSGSSVKQAKDERIFTVRKGFIHILNRNGADVRAPFHPSAGGDAIFVDYNPDLDRLVVTTERGTIGLYDTNGGQCSSFSVRDAVMARWQGDDIFIKLKDGTCYLYNKYGGRLRVL